MSGKADATGVIITWFVESGDQVTPATLIAEVAMDKVDAEVYRNIRGDHRAHGGEQGGCAGCGDRSGHLTLRGPSPKNRHRIPLSTVSVICTGAVETVTSSEAVDAYPPGLVARMM